MDLAEDPLDEEVVLVLLQSLRVLIDFLEHGRSQALRHLGQPLDGEVAMGVDVQGLTLDAAEAARDLRVQAQLEAGLRLAGAVEAAKLDDLAEAEDDVEEVVLGLVQLVIAAELFHQRDELALWRGLGFAFIYLGQNTILLT